MPYFDFNHNHYINVRQEITTKKLIAQNNPKEPLDLANLKLNIIKSVTIPDIWQLTEVKEGINYSIGCNHWYLLNYDLKAKSNVKLAIGRHGCRFFEFIAKDFYNVLNSPVDKLPQPLTADQVNRVGVHSALFDENMWFNKYSKRGHGVTIFIAYEIHKLEIIEVNNKRVLYSEGIIYNRLRADADRDINDGYEPDIYVAEIIIPIQVKAKDGKLIFNNGSGNESCNEIVSIKAPYAKITKEEWVKYKDLLPEIINSIKWRI